jgi:hypothetical protein
MEIASRKEGASVNRFLARRLREVADLLAQQNGNVFRVQAYRNAARQIESYGEPLEELWSREGEEGLRRRLGIGERLASSLSELIQTGKLRLLDRLRGETDPEKLLATVPGIGTLWAARLHQEHHICCLEDLEAAAHDGRLAAIHGFGPKRVAAVMDSLSVRLGRPPRRIPPPVAAVPVEELLDVDREYRERAAANTLPKIAPKRMNPAHEAWLPILHTDRGNRHYTALYSNTPRAHQLGMTKDWVVLYCDGDMGERQWTVVTETGGKLAGRRVVRGRERECEAAAVASTAG